MSDDALRSYIRKIVKETDAEGVRNAAIFRRVPPRFALDSGEAAATDTDVDRADRILRKMGIPPGVDPLAKLDGVLAGVDIATGRIQSAMDSAGRSFVDRYLSGPVE